MCFSSLQSRLSLPLKTKVSQWLSEGKANTDVAAFTAHPTASQPGTNQITHPKPEIEYQHDNIGLMVLHLQFHFLCCPPKAAAGFLCRERPGHSTSLSLSLSELHAEHL